MQLFFISLLILILNTLPLHAQLSRTWLLTDKTLVAWVKIDNLTQRGGSVLTIENGDGAFDAVVFGEKIPAKWMPGSEFFNRTPGDQSKSPVETAKPGQLIQIAIVYQGKTVRIIRDGITISESTVTQPVRFDEQSTVVMGLRHLDAGDRACFAGSIVDARIYSYALSADALGVMKPGALTSIKPLAWWDFSTGKLDDRMGTFPTGKLHGQAKLESGALHLPGDVSYFQTGGQPTRTRETELWPQWHITARPHEGVALPYDANGCIYWKGKYHLMYIYQDPKRPHGGHCWGHLSSTDLVNWTFHPPALLSELQGTDVGIFSGNAFINKEGKPMLCWFGINGGVCVATAEDDDLIHWKKHPQNPIIPMPKKGEPNFGKYTVWDPYLWYEGGQYWCLLGGNTLPNKKDTLYLCTSPDLVNWTPKHSFFEHQDKTWTVDGEDCSCPDFFKIGNKHALLCISHKVGARVYLGHFDAGKEKFFPEQHIRMNWPGGTFFAPESLLDDKGRRIFWAWVTDPRKMTTQRATGSGTQSMPRLLGLSPEGKLTIEPVPELQELRENEITLNYMRTQNGQLPLGRVDGRSLEIEANIRIRTATETGFKVYCDPVTKEETVIRYSPSAKTISIDMSKSTLRKDVKYSAGPIDIYGNQIVPKMTVDAPLELKPDELLKLRIFIDGPMLEVFANGRQCVTQQIFPLGERASQVRFYAQGGSAELVSGKAWTLKAARFENVTQP